jgi:hypothetical protein
LQQLDKDVSATHSNSFGHFKGPQREPWIPYYIIYALIELQPAAARAVDCIRPPRRQWGNISCQALSASIKRYHELGARSFRHVPTWSAAEDLSPIERSEGQKLIGRHRRCLGSTLPNRSDPPSLISTSDPAVRGSALWLAHALMASYHQDASDRKSGFRRQTRQTARLAGQSPSARFALSMFMRWWPEEYRRRLWIAVALP